MKTIVTALAIMLFASVAAANHIGIFYDMEGTQCAGDIPINASTNIYVLAIMDQDITVTGAEFSVSHWLEQSGPPYGFVTATWFGLVIGDVINGISIALDNPIEGRIHHLGTINFFPFLADWIGLDRQWCVTPSLDAGNLIITDGGFNEIPVLGWCFVANCIPGGLFGNCLCDEFVATEEASWSDVKALY